MKKFRLPRKKKKALKKEAMSADSIVKAFKVVAEIAALYKNSKSYNPAFEKGGTFLPCAMNGYSLRDFESAQILTSVKDAEIFADTVFNPTPPSKELLESVERVRNFKLD